MPHNVAGVMPLRLLLLEDDLPDAELLLRTLRNADLDVTCTRVDNEQDFIAQLAGDFDLIISDYKMPSFSGLRALDLAHSHGISIPFIIVSGMIGEDEAVEAIHKGATDYLLKDRLARLGEAVRNALRLRILSVEKAAVDAALQESELRFRQLAENISKVFYLVDPAMTEMFYVSPAYETVWGRSCASLYANPKAWGEAIHPKDIDRVLSVVAPHGTLVVSDVEYRILRPDGSERMIRARSFPVHAASGEVYRFAGLAEDITEKKSMERQLIQAQKMEAVGQLSGGIAHDFNNLLTVILGNVSLMEMLQMPAEAAESLAEVKKAGETAAQLTRQLLLFARKERPEMHRININVSITATSKMLVRILGEDIELDFRPSPEPLFVQADSSMLDQVLMNLAVNARDAMPRGGTLVIATELVSLDQTAVALNKLARPGTFCLLSVTDSGSGIPADLLTKIFDPFFTTKDVGKGTGLGLATIFGIVQQHGGWINVYSETDAATAATDSFSTADSQVIPRHGTTFRVYLPFNNLAATAAETIPRPTVARGGQETILIAEDESAIRSLLTTYLNSLGYTVLAAGSGPEALKLFKAHGQKISLVLTDMIMPGGMTGFDLGTALLKEKADIRIVYSSGYNGIPKTAGIELLKEINFLTKPFTLTALANIIRYQLDLNHV